MQKAWWQWWSKWVLVDRNKTIAKQQNTSENILSQNNSNEEKNITSYQKGRTEGGKERKLWVRTLKQSACKERKKTPEAK